MQGFLEKRGIVNTSFQRRWFRLDSATAQLLYMRQQTDKVAIGAIPLRQATLHITVTAGGCTTFELSSPGHARVYVLRGPTANVHQWAAAVQKCIDSFEPSLALPPGESPGGHADEELSLSSFNGRDDDDPQADSRGVFMEGWMEKMGHVVRSWRRRWFVLRFGRLEYFKNQDDAEPCGVIMLAEGISNLVLAETGAFECYLEVRSVMEGRVYALRAPLAELEAWQRALTVRHGDARVNEAMAATLPRDAPSKAATDIRPAVDPRLLKGKYSKVSESVRRTLAGPRLCKMFCGGKGCKYDCPSKWLDVTAIRGVYASWVTCDILAMSRPSEQANSEFDLVGQFKTAGITAIFNLQMSGEHAHCGPALVAEAFSYDPATFASHGITTHCFGWEDYGTPAMDALIEMTAAMQQVLGAGGKIAVHCHAGLGRTGLLIACYLVYGLGYSGEEAITLVRDRRHGSIQTHQQVQMVKDFAAALVPLWCVFPELNAEDGAVESTLTLSELLARQREVLPTEVAAAHDPVPLVVHTLLTLLAAAAAAQTVDVASAVAASNADTDRLVLGIRAALNRGQWTLPNDRARPPLVYAKVLRQFVAQLPPDDSATLCGLKEGIFSGLLQGEDAARSAQSVDARSAWIDWIFQA